VAMQLLSFIYTVMRRRSAPRQYRLASAPGCLQVWTPPSRPRIGAPPQAGLSAAESLVEVELGRALPSWPSATSRSRRSSRSFRSRAPRRGRVAPSAERGAPSLPWPRARRLSLTRAAIFAGPPVAGTPCSGRRGTLAPRPRLRSTWSRGPAAVVGQWRSASCWRTVAGVVALRTAVL
jgi:hypothetical protein